MVVMRLLRVRSLRLRRALVGRATCFHFVPRGLCLNSALTVERVIRTFDLPHDRVVLVGIVHVFDVHPCDGRVRADGMLCRGSIHGQGRGAGLRGGAEG